MFINNLSRFFALLLSGNITIWQDSCWWLLCEGLERRRREMQHNEDFDDVVDRCDYVYVPSSRLVSTLNSILIPLYHFHSPWETAPRDTSPSWRTLTLLTNPSYTLPSTSYRGYQSKPATVWPQHAQYSTSFDISGEDWRKRLCISMSHGVCSS